MRETILRLVNSCSGIIAQKLLLEMQTEYGPTRLNISEFEKIVEELVEKGRIVRVKYMIPSNREHKVRTGALYLPERSIVISSTQLSGYHK